MNNESSMKKIKRMKDEKCNNERTMKIWTDESNNAEEIMKTVMNWDGY